MERHARSTIGGGRLNTAATPPSEASSASGAMPRVFNDERVELVRKRVRLARGSRGIAGGEHQVVKAAQDKASPAAIRRKTQ
jgi:hypothetical protein